MKNENFNLELLRIFLVVSQFKSFNKASQYLYLDQSTISKKIGQLEKQFNLTLFVRTAKGVELTSDGKLFSSWACKLLKDYESIPSFDSLSWSDLRIGVFDNISAYLYPEFFTKNLTKFNKLKIENKGTNLVEMFNNGELDAIVINRPFERKIKGEFVSQDLIKEGFKVLTSNSSFTQKEKYIKELSNHKLLIAPDYCPVNQELMQYREMFQDIQFLNYSNTMIQMIKLSDYLTILPTAMVKNLTKNDPRLFGTDLLDFPKRTVTVFAREEKVLQKFEILI